MGVRVDQSRNKKHAVGIDHAPREAGRARDGLADIDNLAARYQHVGRLVNCIFAVERDRERVADQNIFDQSYDFPLLVSVAFGVESIVGNFMPQCNIQLLHCTI